LTTPSPSNRASPSSSRWWAWPLPPPLSLLAPPLSVSTSTPRPFRLCSPTVVMCPSTQAPSPSLPSSCLDLTGTPTSHSGRGPPRARWEATRRSCGGAGILNSSPWNVLREEVRSTSGRLSHLIF
jgi:hypothetical protein